MIKLEEEANLNFLQSFHCFFTKRNFLDLLKSVTRNMINAETAELISPYFVKLTELKMEDATTFHRF